MGRRIRLVVRNTLAVTEVCAWIKGIICDGEVKKSERVEKDISYRLG